MSGHSKWSKIKRKKEAIDAKKGAVFTKLIKAIILAAREKGSDLDTNFSLRLAVDKAKVANMPKDNIERAIKRGAGELGGEQIEEIMYEGFGPGGVAFLIQVLSDNKNRIVAEIKHIFSKSGGSLGGSNSVAWMFDKKGLIVAKNSEVSAKKSDEEFELFLMEQDVLDIEREDGDWYIYTCFEDLQKVKEAMDDIGIAIDEASIEWLAKETVDTDENLQEKIEKLSEALGENDDVQNYWTNAA